MDILYDTSLNWLEIRREGDITFFKDFIELCKNVPQKKHRLNNRFYIQRLNQFNE